MPDYMINALFVLTGLLLLGQLFSLMPHTLRPWVRALMEGLAGLVALLLGNTLGGLFGLGLGLNAITLPVSAGLGVPGVALLWALRYLV